MSEHPRSDCARGFPTNDWQETAERLFTLCCKLERENCDLRKLLEADKAFLCSKGFTTLTELIEDKKRLDWIEENMGTVMPEKGLQVVRPIDAPHAKAWILVDCRSTFREGIDAARKATP